MNKKEDKKSAVFSNLVISEEILKSHRELCSLLAVESIHRNHSIKRVFKDWLLKVAGLHDRSKINRFDTSVITNRVVLKSLPDELSGLRVLQLGNLKFPLERERTDSLYDTLRVLDYDICLLFGGIGLGIENHILLEIEVERLMSVLKGNVFSVLGIGDTVRSIDIMQKAGIRVLNNEFTSINILDKNIEIFGAECSNALIDPMFEPRIRSFNLADLRLFFASNPQLRTQVSRFEFDFMLTGTQSCKHCVYRSICKWNEDARRRPKVFKNWEIDSLKGHTSGGLGGGILDDESHSRPELVVHEFYNE